MLFFNNWSSVKGGLPFLQLLHVLHIAFSDLPKLLRMLSQRFSKGAFVVVHIRPLDIVIYWNQDLAVRFATFDDLGELIQAPGRRRIVWWEYDDCDSRLFDCFKKNRTYLLPTLELFIVDEGVDPFLAKIAVKVAGEGVASVLPPETYEDVVAPPYRGDRAGVCGQVPVSHGSCRSDGQCWNGEWILQYRMERLLRAK